MDQYYRKHNQYVIDLMFHTIAPDVGLKSMDLPVKNLAFESLSPNIWREIATNSDQSCFSQILETSSFILKKMSELSTPTFPHLTQPALSVPMWSPCGKMSQESQAAAGSKKFSPLGHFGRSSWELQKEFPQKTVVDSPVVEDSPGNPTSRFPKGKNGVPLNGPQFEWEFPTNHAAMNPS